MHEKAMPSDLKRHPWDPSNQCSFIGDFRDQADRDSNSLTYTLDLEEANSILI